jgi:hypothetical protein
MDYEQAIKPDHVQSNKGIVLKEVNVTLAEGTASGQS